MGAKSAHISVLASSNIHTLVTMQIKFTKRQIPQVMFANCGHANIRLLQDCARLGFISAGQGKADGNKPYYFSNQIRDLIIGDILAVYRNKIGFVGIARVISKPMPITNAYLGGQKVKEEIFSQAANMFSESEEPGYEEWLVEVEWLTNVHLNSKPKSGACFGRLSLRKVICSLVNQQELKKELEKAFDINFQTLLVGVKGSPIQEENEELSFPEGKEQYKLHKKKERNRTLVKLAKERYLQINKKLSCQVCNFSFVEQYGQLGEGFIEAHHTYPISLLKEETKTKLEDLVFVCSNCHRMLHLKRPWLELDELKKLLLK